jgi:hypothetical protein
VKRTALLFLLTLPPRPAQTPGAIEVAEVLPVRGGAPARLCPGDNAVRVTLRRRDTTAAPRTAALRLVLVLPGGPPAGTLLAEGSATAPAGAGETTFTFLHVEVAERLRGRGARLVVRAVGEERALPMDGVTDWSCRQL